MRQYTFVHVFTSCYDDISFCAVIKTVDSLWNSKLSDRAENQKRANYT